MVKITPNGELLYYPKDNLGQGVFSFLGQDIQDHGTFG
jgi:hypothetical protein